MTANGADPLIKAIQAGVLTLEPLVHENESYSGLPSDILLERYLDVVNSSLANGKTYPLFDDGTGQLARLGLDAGYFVRSAATQERASNAAVGTGLIDRLPHFPNADMSEVLDIRLHLEGPLGRFRRAVRSLSAEIELPPEDPEFHGVLNDRWLHEVQPAIEEIEERIRQEVSLRALTRQAIADAFDPIRTAIPAAGIGGLTFAAGGRAWLVAAATVAVQGVAPAIAAAQGRRQSSNEIGKAQYYFYIK